MHPYFVGHPNVGKSSMVNHILGRKAVSVKVGRRTLDPSLIATSFKI